MSLFVFTVRSNPCALGSAELYQPHPKDETRYIQCSLYGKSYIKSCPAGQVWNNGLKTCIHRQTSGAQQPSGNQQIYTTGPFGYQMTSNQYDHDHVNYGYHYNYENNNNYGQNGYQNQGEPQYYIDANNNAGIIYSPSYSNSERPGYQANNIQNDIGREYNTGSWSSDIPTYSAQQHYYARGNFLWNTFAGALQPSNQNSKPQGNRIYGQSMVGATNHQQSGTVYGTNTGRTVLNTRSYYQPAQRKPLWNSYLMGDSNSVSHSQPAQTNTYTVSRAPSTRSTYSTGSSAAYLVDRNKVKTGYVNSGQAYTSKPVQHHNTMVNAQKQAPVKTQQTHRVSIIQPISGFDVPGLCKDAIRYIPAQNDYHHFYECVKGSAQIKTCPDGKLWVHPLRQCLDLNDHNNQIASHNPCIGSDLRFHPYPADPTKYVECQSWYRVYVWRCKDGLWTQNKQQCSKGTHHGTSGSNNNQNVHTVQTWKGFCDGKTFYYAHEDAAKYIQCDAHGKWFLKDCALNTTWDDSIKGCVEVFSISGPGDITVNTVTTTVNTMDRSSRQLSVNSADVNFHTYPCPGNYAWDIPLNECVVISQSDYLPTCARGYMWDPKRKECITYVDPTTVEEFPDAQYARPNCMTGHRWDPELQMCVKDTFGSQVNTEYSNFLFEIDLGEMNFRDSNSQQNLESTYEQTGDNLDYLPNICNTIPGRYYYPYPHKPHWFIQCDQLGVMHTQTCGIHNVWNKEIMTCVHSPSTIQPGHGRQYTGSYQGNNDGSHHGNKVSDQNIYGNVCSSDSDKVYYRIPENNRMFIMCDHGSAYMMSCPRGSRWKDDITSCDWPPEGNN